ncbi:MAG: autotransporter outer membrane beta-barrel domain-containing protein [Proteobacteria bacterium]|nr:autotransporter outer membrane beta-barrel domain-containing protein [Desulfobacula sp.]MBU4129935.1 autotransporter outer membrane beta-barrel domain-containing protein [Pseudomonadota bacterium]
MKKLMVLAVLLVFITGSAYAADWNFYGSARVQTTYTNFKASPFSPSAAALGLALGNETSNYEQKLYGNARIGANVKVSDELTGQFEYGAQSSTANIRILWGEWNFGAGSLGVGQNYTPLLFPYSNQTYSIDTLNKGDHNMSTFGMLYGGRKAQIRLEFGDFQIAAVEPKTLVSLPVGLTAIGRQQPTTEVKFPSIQAKYKFDFDNGHISAAAGYQTFDVLSGASTYSVDSYILGLGGRIDFGGLYFKGNVWGGQNVGNMADILVNQQLWSTTGNAGSSNFDGDGWGLAQWTGTGLNDRDAIAALIVAGYKIREGLYLEAGYGYVQTELDVVNSVEDDADTYYAQATIFLAPGVFLTPEIGRCDMKQANQSVVTYYGIKWQINF